VRAALKPSEETEASTRDAVIHAAWTSGALFLWGEQPWEDGALVTSAGLKAMSPGGAEPETRTLILPAAGRLAPQEVPGLPLAPAETLTFLSGLPEGEDPSLGSDLRFWARAGKFVLELLARQRFAPGLRDGEARWRPVLDDPRDGERIRLLAESMPPACRAARPNVARRALLLDFIATLVDAAVRDTWNESPLPAEDPVDRWLAALGRKDARIQGSEADLRVLRDEVDAWTSQLGGDLVAPFRTCFKLEEPPAERAPWRLAFEIQAADDPSLRLPAPAVWRGGRDLEARFPAAPERLLADLGRASRLFPPIHSALRQRAPASCAMSTESAYLFLREASSLFEESGFGVLVPPWWRTGRARIGVRLALEPSRKGGAAAAAGTLGLESLVHFDWQVAVGTQALSRQEFERLARMKVPLVRVRGQWVELRRDDLDRALQALGSRRGEMTLQDALRIAGLRDAGLPITGVRARGWVAELLEARYGAVPPPAGLRAELRPYQLRGLAWLLFLRRIGLGACLADDMGLGKTVQVLAALLASTREGPSLVVCPTSVLHNWEQEISRFAPGLKTITHHGADRDGRFDSADVVLTSYGTLLRDQEQLARTRWDTFVVDEAQNIKNAEAKQSKAARDLEARFRVALTGTPVENRLADLWSIFEFLNPGYLGPAKSFRQTFSLPIERYRDEKRAEALRRLVQPFLLRRVKTDPSVIRDLPDKIESKVFCTLTKEQATLYQAVVAEMMDRIESAKEGIERRGEVLAAITKLKQVCNHPAQFLKDRSAFPGRSGKVARLEELLEELISEGERALLFTQFTGFADLLVPHLRRRFGREVLYLHGGVTAKARRDLVRRFQAKEGPPLLVLSLRAGGTGLNLTAATHVFHVDRWWNPAVENQATDRAFRIGQTRKVQVHKFVCRGTLEERVDELIESKKELAGRIVGAGEAWLTELSTRELRDIFTLRSTALEG
jgi:superfamily II DNA or RNA helicase